MRRADRHGARARTGRPVAGLVAGVGVAAVAAAGVLMLGRVDGAWGDAAGPDRMLAPYRNGQLHDAAAPGAARAALIARPVEGAAYRVLARQAQQEGEGVRAVALLEAALRHWPRDVPGRAIAADTALRAGDHAAAWRHLDALLRAEPEAARTLLVAALPAIATPAGREALAARLQSRPPWRGALAQALRGEGLPWPHVEALWSRLDALGPTTPAEVAAHVHALEQLGRPADARARWLRSVGAGGQAGAVFDGGFDRPGITGPYAWALPEHPGVDLAYERTAGEGALVARFSGRAVRFGGLAQTLALAPGPYRLEARAENGTRSERPFEWHLHCIDGGARLARLALPSNGADTVSAAFEVGAGCPRQRLELRHDARFVGEQAVSGTLRLLQVGILPSG